MQLDRFKVNLLLKELREGESSVTSLSLLGILDLSQLEPEYLLAVFDKLKEFGTVYQYLDEHPQPGLVRTLLEKIAAGTNLKTCTYPENPYALRISKKINNLFYPNLVAQSWVSATKCGPLAKL